ncbi:hypothetical protein C0995_012740 [Termitomyces sp. Mi166|nr:hypothetical protein C0995_012740 [Termitomyces sp. Mi166\
MSKEKGWAAELGMLDWDSTNIVFTKRSLIEFLKYTGTTVDTNFNNIAKLPRYAQFGKISDEAPDDSPATEAAASQQEDVLKSTRSTRPALGSSIGDLLGDHIEDDALALAPPKEIAANDGSESGFKPSRRVRTTPGGPSSIGNLWDAPEAEEFKPTRRVRQGPGGQDSISDVCTAGATSVSLFPLMMDL